uniref:ANK_REP_REGION domain-containing protein n=1 Tax=Macrostomum lignano TaxID=282301 RepID=A0A1I8G0P4_9PLAT
MSNTKCYTYVAKRSHPASEDGEVRSLRPGDLVVSTELPKFDTEYIKGRNESTLETGLFSSNCLERCIRARLLRNFKQLRAGAEALITDLSLQHPGCSFYCNGNRHTQPIEMFYFERDDDLAVVMTVLSEHVIQGDFERVRQLASRELMMMHGDQGRNVLMLAAESKNSSPGTANDNLRFLTALTHVTAVPFDWKWQQNDQGRTPLMEAARLGNWKCAKHLLHLFRQQRTILWQCVQDNQSNESLLRLLMSKADPTCADVAGSSCLHAAVRKGNEEVIKALIDAGVNVNERTEDGVTALMRVATSSELSDSESVTIADLLLDAGADWTIESNSSSTALKFAVEHGKNSLVKLLSHVVN